MKWQTLDVLNNIYIILLLLRKIKTKLFLLLFHQKVQKQHQNNKQTNKQTEERVGDLFIISRSSHASFFSFLLIIALFLSSSSRYFHTKDRIQSLLSLTNLVILRFDDDRVTKTLLLKRILILLLE